MNEKLAQFRTKYIEILREFRASKAEYQGWPIKDTPEQTVDKMIEAINKSGARNDWLKYNEAMKVAAKSVGIKTSPELREFIKSALAEVQS